MLFSSLLIDGDVMNSRFTLYHFINFPLFTIKINFQLFFLPELFGCPAGTSSAVFTIQAIVEE